MDSQVVLFVVITNDAHIPLVHCSHFLFCHLENEKIMVGRSKRKKKS
jgi:hypothetical protein